MLMLSCWFLVTLGTPDVPRRIDVADIYSTTMILLDSKDAVPAERHQPQTRLKQSRGQIPRPRG